MEGRIQAGIEQKSHRGFPRVLHSRTLHAQFLFQPARRQFGNVFYLSEYVLGLRSVFIVCENIFPEKYAQRACPIGPKWGGKGESFVGLYIPNEQSKLNC